METTHPKLRPANKVLRNKYGRAMRSYEILELFGLPPTSPIPPKFRAYKRIDGVKVLIIPRGKRAIKRRVLAQCPTCFKQVCAGHLHQHMKVHNDRTRGSI
jgi:hypothetical protein